MKYLVLQFVIANRIQVLYQKLKSVYNLYSSFVSLYIIGLFNY